MSDRMLVFVLAEAGVFLIWAGIVLTWWSHRHPHDRDSAWRERERRRAEWVRRSL